MELYKEIVKNLLSKQNVSISFPELEESIDKIVISKCYQTLQKIRAIIDDDSLKDMECLVEIVRTMDCLEKTE